MADRKISIIDAHTHFFSHSWLSSFQEAVKERFATVEQVAEHLGWDAPPSNPVEFGGKWVAEQDKHGVAKQVLFASKINDAEFLAAAISEHRSRLVGYFMVNPKEPDARNRVVYSLNILDMKGILLFPAMHHFNASDACAYTIYEEAVSAGVPVFIHFGRLNIPIYEKLGIAHSIDLSYSNPMDLAGPATDFQEANFIIPHFGSGRFEEALTIAGRFPNVYFDTSSSNSWIAPPLTLGTVFEKALQVLGPERLLFGTDSSTFPRGWRHDIYEQQLGILNELRVSEEDQAAILGGNIARILDLT